VCATTAWVGCFSSTWSRDKYFACKCD